MDAQLKSTGRILIVLLLVLACWTLAAGTVGPSQQATDEPVTATDSGSLPASPTDTATPTETPTETPTSTISATVPESVPPPVNLEALEGRYVPDEVVVGLGPSGSLALLQPCLEAVDGDVTQVLEALNVIVVAVPFGTVGNALAGLGACPGVEYVEPNYLVYLADVIPSDPGWGVQYALPLIRAPQGWSYTTGSAAVVIAILDTGIDLDHPDLAAKLVPGWNFINPLQPPDDDNGHGTHVAGIAAASSNNATGIAGVSWGARLMPVKVVNQFGLGSSAILAEGITWAVNNGAQVINVSLGTSFVSNALGTAINYAYAHDVVVVAAAGNTGGGGLLYPAAYDHVIAVSATDSGNNLAPFSAVGPQVDLAAPGVAIYATSLGGGYMNRDGTSQATAHVSGLAAILRGIPGCGSAANIEWLMESTALDLGAPGHDSAYGYGLIQMDTAIATIFPTPVPATEAGTPFYFPGFAIPSPTGTSTLTATRLAGGGAVDDGPSATPSASPSASPTATDLAPAPQATRTPWTFPEVKSPALFCSGAGLLLLGLGLLGFLRRFRKRRRTTDTPLKVAITTKPAR